MELLDQVLSSFTATLSLPTPITEEIEAYRTFLATEGLITDAESRFLDVWEDLVDLCPHAKPDDAERDADLDAESVFFDDQAVDNAMLSSSSRSRSPLTSPNAAASEGIAGQEHKGESRDSLYAWLPALVGGVALLHGIGLECGPRFTIRSIIALLVLAVAITVIHGTSRRQPGILTMLSRPFQLAVTPQPPINHRP
jgi:hypothetical protein